MSPVATSKIQLKDPSLFVQQGWINGKGVDAKSGKTFEVEDPSTRAVIGHAPEMDRDDALEAIASCQKTFEGPWRKTTARERARLLRKYNDLVLENKEDLAKLIVAENGKPLKEAEGEVVYAASFLEWFAGEAERTYGVTIPAVSLCGLVAVASGRVARTAQFSVHQRRRVADPSYRISTLSNHPAHHRRTQLTAF